MGGNGGAILIRSNGASSAIQTGHLSSSGAAPGYIGDGGHAGAVTVEGLGANSGVTTGNISAAGGIGSFQGQFALGASGGNGGNVKVNGKGNVTTGFIDAHGEGASANTGRNNLTTGRGGVIAVTASTGSSDVSTGALSSYSGDAFCNGNRSCTLQAAGNITVSSTGFIKVDGAVQAQGGNASGGNAPNNGAAAGNVSITSTATTSGKSVLINGRINAAGGNGSGGNGFGSGASGGAAGSVTVSSAGVGGAGSNVAIAGGINALGGAASGTGAQAVAGASKAVNVTATDGYVWQAAGNYFNGLSVAVIANRGIGAGSGALDMTGATAPDMSSRLGVAAANSTARNGFVNPATKAGALRVTYAGGALTLSNQFQNGFVPGDFDLAVPNGDLTLSGLGRTGSANVSLSTGGNLTLTNNGLISTVSGNIRLEAAGNIGVGNQARAETTSGDLYAYAGGSITQTNEYHSLVANNLAIRAGGAVGEGSGNGRLVTQANNLSLAAGGNVLLYNNTALNIGSVTFGGATVPGGVINGASSSGGALWIGSGSTLSGTGPVTASSVSLSAAGGIDLGVDTASLTATDTSGPIAITLANGGTVENVSTTGTVNLAATAGDLNVKTVSGSDVSLTAAAGAITDANGTDNNITATTLTASSQNGIALGTDVSGLQTLSTAGATADISISTARAIDTANYNITTDTGTTQNVSLTSSSASGITVGNAFASTNDNISFTATAGGINLNSAIGAAGLALNAQGGISAPAGINVTGVFELKAGTFSQVGSTLPTFSAGDFRISGGTFVRALAGDGLSTGTAYQIADIYGLQGAGSAGMLDKNFKLANNIDASGTVNWNAGAGFNPIASGAQFLGTLDGGGHVIDQLVINRPGDANVGLISLLNSGTVSNVGLTGGSVTGDDTVGALVGRSIGTIINSHSSAAVNGITGTAGGLVGLNFGTISGSYSSGAVTGAQWLGGLVGTNTGTVSGSYATGAVVGARAGGLVGNNASGGTISDSYASGAVGAGSGYTVGGLTGINSGTITHSYATGAVTGGWETGGLVGWSNSGTVNNSFWDTQTTGQATSGGGGTGVLTADMMKAQTFVDAGWSASNVGGDGTTWRIYEGQTGPLLRGFLTGLTLADTSVTYNGSTQTGASTALAGVSGSSASGRNAGSYATGYYSNQQGYDIIGGGLDIARADLTLSTSDVTKTYDGTTSAAGTAVATAGTALLGGDTASGGSFAFTDKNVGTGNKTVTAAGVTVNDGNGGNNYNISYVDHTTSTINKADLTVTATGVTKTYDGTTSATGTGSVGTLAGAGAGESVNTAATQAFLDKNFGIGNKAVRASGVTIKDSGNVDVTGNYNIAYVDDTTSTINRADLTVTATGVTKTYDGTTSATGTGSVGTLAGAGAGESVNAAATQVFTDKNFGIGNKTVQASGLTIKDSGNADVTGNYNISYVDNTTSTINKANLTVTATGVTKTYDGTTSATGTGAVAALAGAGAGEVVDAAGSQAFLDKNFGMGNKAVRASGVTIKDSGNADVTGNYNIAYVDDTTSTINKANLTLSTSDVTKTYDGGLSASGAVVVAAGQVFAGDNTSGGSFAFTDKNAGSGNKTVQTSGVTVGDGVNNANYNVTYADNTTSTINQASLVLSTSNVTKTYDGTLAASGTAAVSAGTLFGGDSLTGGSFAFTDKNAGSGNKTVTAAGVTVNDGNGGNNYSVSYVDNTTSTINKADLTVTATGVTKIYDGTTSATGTGSVGTLAGAGAGESVNTAATQVFTDKNFGLGNKTVQASGLTIKDSGNADVTGNYNIAYVDNTTSTINKADLTVTANAVTKTYDGTTAASGMGTVAALAGAGAGEVVDAGGSQAFLDKNFGIGNKVVRASGVTIKDSGNADVTGNYNIAYVDNTTSTINKANVTLSTSDVTKTYDGGQSASGAVVVTAGQIFTGDNATGGTFAFTDKNFGVGNKTVTTTGVTVGDGVNNANYNVSYADNTTSTINKADLTVTATGVTKIYDGTTSATGTGSVGTLAGAGAGESVNTAATQVFTDKNFGIGNKTVQASGLTIKDSGNADVTGNYNISYVDNTTSTINKANLTVTANAVTKTYDGTLAATGTGTVATLAGAGAGEVVNAAGSQAFLDKNFGIGNKAVRASGVTIKDSGNADVTGNYNIAYVDNATSTINKADLSLSTSDVTKTYDGGFFAAGTVIVTAGTVFAGDNTTGGAFTFIDKNAGTGNKTVLTSGVTVGDGVNNSNYNVSYVSNNTSTINQANLVLTTNNVTKTYDGTLVAAGTAAVASGTVFSGDSLSGGSFAFTDKNAGTGNKTVTAAGVTVNDGNGGNNYSVSYVDNTNSTINKADLTVTATGVTKTYDGTLSATGNGSVGVLAGAGAGESVNTAATQVFTDKNFGIGNKTVQASGLTIKDSGNADVTGNYNIAYVDNTTSTINKADVTLSTSDVTKTYDGGLSASGAVVVTAGQVFAGDSTSGGTFAFTDKNFGVGNKTVTTTGVTVGDGVNNANYNVSYADNTTSTINQASLVLSTSNVTKTYDGNTTATGTATVAAGSLFGGDSLTGGSFAFTDKNAGNGNKTVTAGGVTVGDGVNNANYSVSYVDNTTSTINPFAVSVSGTRTYDGTADVAAGVLHIGPLVGSETLGLSGLATMADKNVGANKTLTVAGLNLIDGSGLASNYTFTGGTQQASITQASLTVGTGNVTKTYDSNTSAAGTAMVTGGTLFSGDNLTGGTFAFTDKNAGTGNKTVTTTGVTVGDGVNNGNYAVTYANNTTSTINKADLTVTASGVSKVYDGTTAATVGYGDNRLGSDVLSITGTASFADKNAGTGKTVGVNSIALGGTDAGNYNLLNTTTNTTASITPKALTVTANGDTRLYDGSAYSGGNGVSYSGFVAGDSLADIGGILGYGGSSQGAVAAGNYVITAGGLNSISGNYALGFASGALSITTSNASAAALGNAALVSSYDGALQAVAGLGGSSGGGGMGASADAMAGALAAAAAEAGDADNK
ncbi:YDG domain protein [compost metagenome]